jgi:hypothetical protein
VLGELTTVAYLYKFLITPNHILYGMSCLIEELALAAKEDVMSSFRTLRSLWRRHHLMTIQEILTPQDGDLHES